MIQSGNIRLNLSTKPTYGPLITPSGQDGAGERSYHIPVQTPTFPSVPHVLLSLTGARRVRAIDAELSYSLEPVSITPAGFTILLKAGYANTSELLEVSWLAIAE